MPRLLLAPLAFLSLGAFMTATAAEPSLARLLPADTALVLAVHDVPSLRKEFPESSVGRAWADPEIARFFAPLSKHVKMKGFLDKLNDDTGYTPGELFALASGDIYLSLPISSLSFTSGEPDADILLAIEVGDNEVKLRDLIAEQRKRETTPEADYTSEDYNGVTLHTQTSHAASADAGSDGGDSDSVQSIVWALHEGRWFLATKRELVTTALDALAADGLASSLATEPEYLKAIDRSGGDIDMLFYLNWSAVYPALISAIESARDPAAQPNMFGIEPIGVMKALGLDAIQTISISAVTANDIDRVDAAITYREAQGLLALAAYRDGPVARPDWIPASWYNITSQNFSLPDAYQELERLVDRISPAFAGLVQGQIKGFERQLEIDLKRDIIGNIGLSFLSGYALPPDSNSEMPPAQDELDQFIAISLADAAVFERAIETIKTKYLPPGDASPLKKRDYLGRAVYSTEVSEGGGRGFTYAITDGWLLLVIGTPGSVESVVQLMHTPNPDNSFWQRGDVRDALADVPPGAFSVQHTELAPMLASFAASLVKMQGSDGDADTLFLDPEAVPTREQLSRHFKHSVSHGIRTQDGFYFQAKGPAR